MVSPLRFIACGLSIVLLCAPAAEAVTIRVACYNIEADVNGDTAPNPGLDTVLEAIGEQNVNGVVQPLDVLTLEETTSNTDTVAPIVADLNTYYGADTYAASPYQATETGGNPGTGNGPNALIYNTTTLTLIDSIGVGTPQGSTNGEYRQVVRYELQPVTGTVANAFYVYVCHMKSSASGAVATVQADRNEEAKIVRADSATLPANASVLYMGDFNLDGSTEAAYQTMTASGANQGVDPLNYNPQNDSETWHSATYQAILTESATALSYRDDIQFVGSGVFAGSLAGGLQFLAGSYRAFGNNGTTTYEDSVDSSSNTALANLSGPITASQALSALTTASDHLPVVADYSIALTTAGEGTLQFSAANYPVNEDAGSVTVTVARSGGSTGAISVAYATSDGTAVAGTDYTAASGTLSWADGDTSAKTFSVKISDRQLFDGSTRTLNVALSSPSAGATLGTQAQATVTILENDAAAGTVQFSAANYSIDENAGTLIATVDRTGSSAGAVSVAYVTSNGTAVAGTDYAAKTGTLSWAAGDATPKTFTLTIIDRGLTDGSSRTLNVALSSPSAGATLGTQAQATVTILENDAATGTGAGTVQFSAASYSVDENAGTLVATVDRTGGSAGAVLVAYATSNGTAVAGTDYVAKTGTLAWAAGDATAKTCTLSIIDRGLTGGGNRTLGLTLSDASGGSSLGTQVQAVVTILDNDTPIVAPPVLTGPAEAGGRVDEPFTYQIEATNKPTSYAASGLPEGVKVNATTGTISGMPKLAAVYRVTLSATNAIGTGSARLTLTVSHSRPKVHLFATVPVAYVHDRSPAHFTVSREGDVSEPLTVKFFVRGTAKNGVDYKEIPRELTFRGGRLSRKIVIVPLGAPVSDTRSVVLKLMPADDYAVETHRKVTVEIRDER